MSTAEPAAPGPRSASWSSGPSITAAVARFMISSLVVVVLIGSASVVLTRREGTDEAVRTATEVAALVGRNTVAPLLTDELMSGDPAALARLDRAMRAQVLDGEVVRVKIWTAGGRVVYADEPALIGRTFALDDEDRAALVTGRATGDLSSLDRDENAFERGGGPLLQVYVPLRSSSGDPVLFEMYQHASGVLTDRTRLWRTFLPVALGGVLLLWAIQGPLAYAMARRLRAGHEDRERLLTAAADSARLERRRVAADLHDGTIQNLAGVAYELEAGADDADSGGPPARAGTVLREGAENVRRVIRQLRALVIENSPPELRDGGLASALTDVVAPLAIHGVETRLSLQPDVRAPEDVEALLFRGAQEAVRNVVRHADARNVELSLAQDAGGVTLRVEDDGRGFAPADLARAREDGHVGLKLLEDLVRDRGGRLSVASREGSGTTVEIAVPA